MKTLLEVSGPHFAYWGERGDWFSVLGQHRDSGCIERSNFRVALARLGGEGEDVAVERSSHCLVGWSEGILVRPGSPKVAEAEALHKRLEDYPVLSDDDLSALEYDEACQTWEEFSTRDRVYAIRRYGDGNIFAARRAEIPNDPTGSLMSYLCE